MAKRVFGALGYQGQKMTQKTRSCLAVPPKAARPKNHSCLENVWLFGLGTPGLQKTTWPTQTLRDPFEEERSARSSSKEQDRFLNTSTGVPKLKIPSAAQNVCKTLVGLSGGNHAVPSRGERSNMCDLFNSCGVTLSTLLKTTIMVRFRSSACM